MYGFFGRTILINSVELLGKMSRINLVKAVNELLVSEFRVVNTTNFNSNSFCQPHLK